MGAAGDVCTSAEVTNNKTKLCRVVVLSCAVIESVIIIDLTVMIKSPVAHVLVVEYTSAHHDQRRTKKNMKTCLRLFTNHV